MTGSEPATSTTRTQINPTAQGHNHLKTVHLSRFSFPGVDTLFTRFQPISYQVIRLLVRPPRLARACPPAATHPKIPPRVTSRCASLPARASRTSDLECLSPMLRSDAQCLRSPRNQHQSFLLTTVSGYHGVVGREWFGTEG